MTWFLAGFVAGGGVALLLWVTLEFAAELRGFRHRR